MNKKQRYTDMTALPSALLIGVLVSMAVTLVLTGLMAYLMAGERVGEDSIHLIAVAVLIVSAGVGAVSAYQRVGHHRLLVCIASGGGYFLILLACTALIFDGMYQSVGITALAVSGGSCAAALLGLGSGRTARKQRYTKHHNFKIVQNRQRGN